MAYPGYHEWDAIVFIPKTDIWFFGFGTMSNEERENITLRFQWAIDGQESGE